MLFLLVLWFHGWTDFSEFSNNLVHPRKCLNCNIATELPKRCLKWTIITIFPKYLELRLYRRVQLTQPCPFVLLLVLPSISSFVCNTVFSGFTDFFSDNLGFNKRLEVTEIFFKENFHCAYTGLNEAFLGA